ncbi:hypothetical protein INT43_006819 [Umbelopsis isabellina]|uniref:PH domain-containing protein n=1 Tax=Mortierella isabellina TaxID=91625 RepID=A0A8H7Q1V2_MORIS|nr:hypothetical protein INT43_006819 [Umbelopsis isabellina]
MVFAEPFHQPRAGWLSKMRQHAFGRLGWSYRFVVLLGSELRYYKNEYAETPSRIMNLKSIKGVSMCPTSTSPFAFRLDPIEELRSSSRNTVKPLVLRAETEHEMLSWIEAITSRLPHQGTEEQACYFNTMNCCFQLVTPPLSPSVGSPRQPCLDTKFSSLSVASIASDSSIASEVSSIHDNDSKISLCARRGIKINPINVYKPNKMSCWIPMEEDVQSDDETCDSPTFALYKERFGL